MLFRIHPNPSLPNSIFLKGQTYQKVKYTSQIYKPEASMETNTIEAQWNHLLTALEENVGKRPADLNGVLFLIGVQELGKGTLTFTKEQKQDLMHIGICKVLSFKGYYELESVDADGWPHWKLLKKLDFANVSAQEEMLKQSVINYFVTEIGI